MNRMLGYHLLPTTIGSFEDDIEDGLTSSYFDLEANLEQNDQRAGLKDKEEILKIMKKQKVSFDEARLIRQQRLLKKNVRLHMAFALSRHSWVNIWVSYITEHWSRYRSSSRSEVCNFWRTISIFIIIYFITNQGIHIYTILYLYLQFCMDACFFEDRLQFSRFVCFFQGAVTTDVLLVNEDVWNCLLASEFGQCLLDISAIIAGIEFVRFVRDV